MPIAYLLIDTEVYEPSLLEALRSIKGVEEAYAVYGTYDIVAMTRAPTMSSLKETHNKIRKLPKIRHTVTMIAHEE